VEPLEHFKEYVERFQQFNFNDFSKIYHSLYSDYKNIQDRIEFSLLINPKDGFDLRFGLFKIYESQKISSLFTKMGFGNYNLENILSSVENFVPEFAVGFDFNKKIPRTKVYFLRLPDNIIFNENPTKIINFTSKLININLTNCNEQEIKDCYLMAIDFCQNDKQNIKIYTRNKNVNLDIINNYLKDNHISSQYFKKFQELFSEGQLKDVTISRKYSQIQNNPKGLSVFFEVEDNLNESIEQLVKTCIPEKFSDFKEIVETLEMNKPVKYSHIGVTFSENTKKENICLYFSPVLENIKK